MRLVLLGPPGVGKGSLATLCEERLGLAQLSPGVIFRQEMERASPLGRRVQQYVSRGLLVPDALVVQVMSGRLTPKRVRRGFVLDGFPRTVGQAQGLDRVLAHQQAPLQAAIGLMASEALLVRRLSGRRVCRRCGANYHVRTMRPKRLGRCDRCGGALIIRKDDASQTIRKRLAVDRAAAAPLLRYYRKQRLLHLVNGAGSVATVFRRTMKLIRQQGWLRPGDAPTTSRRRHGRL